MPVERLRQYAARGEYLRARRESERLIMAGELAGVDRVQVHRVAAYAHYYLQDVYGAAKLCERALQLANQLPCPELAAKCQYDLGEIYLATGDLHLAREHLEQLLAAAAQVPGLRSLQAKAHHNLALIFRQRHEYQKALASHQMAAELFQQEGDLRQMAEALRGLIWCHLTMDEPHAAKPYLHQVSAYLQQHQDESLAATFLTDMAFYHRLTGDLTRSISLCEEVLVPGRPGADDHVLATACWLAGENALDLRHYQEASILAHLSLKYALNARHPLLMNRTANLRRRIGQTDPSQVSG